MRYYHLIITGIVALFFFSGSATGQITTGRRQTGDLKHAQVDSFINELEHQYPYRFFYNNKDFDSVTINFSAKAGTLPQVLQLAFSNTDIYFAIDNDNHVFITKGKAVTTVLVPGLLTGAIADSSTAVKAKDIVGDNNKNKPAQKSSLENKLYEIGQPGAGNNTDQATLDGYVLDSKTGEPLSGASVFVEKLKISTIADHYGYYNITLPKGQHILNIQSIGIKDSRRLVLLRADGRMNIELQSQVMTLKNITMSAQKLNNIKSAQMGVQTIDIRAIKQVPVAFGEADILRVVLTLPGVKSVGEASTGLNVRGGAADQNLILFNDATIYNPSHFFGLFSAFNPELVKDVELYKSSIPAKFGGRLSSVIDINTRDGNKKKLAGTAGIGLLTSRFNLEGPLVQGKSSFILGARTTYAKWLLSILPDQYKNSRASFNDVNLNINHELSKKSTLFLTAYISNDRFNLNSDTFYAYGNRNISLKLKQVFNNKLNALFTAGYDRYQYNISSDHNPVTAYKLGFDINQTYLKAHFNYYLSAQHKFEFGLNSLFYKLHPGSYVPVGQSSLVLPDTVATEQALESALYISDRYNISSAFSIEAGLRYSIYNYLGPHNVNEYAAGVPRSTANLLQSVSYSGGHFIKTYTGPEIRFSMRYAFSDSFSIKAGYNTQRQYIHSISNITSMAPTDIWKLSDQNIRPQHGDQVSLGIYKNIRDNTIEASVEVYYKKIRDYLDYKSGALLIMNDHLETDVINTRGKAYGLEVMLKKANGKLNGWISYTWSRTLLQMDDPIAGELINEGKYYPANYDKPQDLTFIGNYRINHRFSISVNAT